MPIALLSVSDKTGLQGLARALSAAGFRLLASGGTAKAVSEAGLPVEEVAAYSGSPEILGGRVKTLHPAVHGGILARGTEADRAELASLGWSEIDLVVCNLYPFEATAARQGVDEAACVEEIDIGGVALLRAAAKNFARVAVACDPADYAGLERELAEAGAVSAQTRRRLAVKAFALCARYDAAIASWLDPASSAGLFGYAAQGLRYGENPHQRAWLFSDAPGAGPLGGSVLQGKELSYNNLLDLDAAWRAAASFDGPSAVVVKHLSPCGVAELTPGVAELASGDHASPAKALEAAIACDPVSAFGGVLAVNRPFDGDCVRALGQTFVECIAAPSFTDEARELLAKRKNARLLALGEAGLAAARASAIETRSVLGGFLRQELDLGDPAGAAWKAVSAREPTEAELATLRFAWRASVSAKSNAIVLAAPIMSDYGSSPLGFATVGIGSGQPNRVDSTRLAVARAGDRARGAVLASDAFFPFPDSVEVAAAAGVRAIAHPGGSIRDADSVAAADAADLAMVVTGVRHFRH